jgi:malate synthase
MISTSELAAEPPAIAFLASVPEGADAILNPDALALLIMLHRRFNPRRLDLLELRGVRQKELDAGASPDFLLETEEIRTGEWRVAPVPPDLQDRRVEITGPVERKMIINALNSPAKTFMADFEDSCSPTWKNVLDGQVNLRDAIAGIQNYEGLASGPISFCAASTPQCRDGNRTPVLISYVKGGKDFEVKVLDRVTMPADFGL